MQTPTVTGEGDMGEEIRSQLTILKQRVTETGLELERCRQVHEAFTADYFTAKEQAYSFNNFVQQNGENHPDVKKFRAKKDIFEKHVREKVKTKQKNPREFIRSYNLYLSLLLYCSILNLSANTRHSSTRTSTSSKT